LCYSCPWFEFMSFNYLDVMFKTIYDLLCVGLSLDVFSSVVNLVFFFGTLLFFCRFRALSNHITSLFFLDLTCWVGKIEGTYDGWVRVGLEMPPVKWSEQILVNFEGCQLFLSTPFLFTSVIQRSLCSKFLAGNWKNLTIPVSLLVFRWHWTTQQVTILSWVFTSFLKVTKRFKKNVKISLA
jgi:hypothetical protein